MMKKHGFKKEETVLNCLPIDIDHYLPQNLAFIEIEWDSINGMNFSESFF